MRATSPPPPSSPPTLRPNFRFAGASATYDDHSTLSISRATCSTASSSAGRAASPPTTTTNQASVLRHLRDLSHEGVLQRLDESLTAKRSSSRGYWLGLPPAIGVHFPEVAKLRTFLTCYMQMMHEAAAASRRLFAELGVAEPSSLRPWAKDATIDETLLRRVSSLFEAKFAEYNLQITGELRPGR